MFSIDTTDNNDAITQNGDEVEFSFNIMINRWDFLHNLHFWRNFPPIDQFQNFNGHNKCAAGTYSINELFG